MAANKIILQVDFQTGGAQQSIDEINKRLDSIGTTAEKTGAKATQGMQGFSVTVTQMSSALRGLGQIIGGLSVARLAKEFWDLGNAMMQVDLALKAMGIDSAKFSRQIAFVAEETGFRFDKLKQDAGRLVTAFKIPEEQAAAMVRTIANFVRAKGMSQEVIGQWVTLLGTASETGRFKAKGTMDAMAAMGISTREAFGLMGLSALEFKKLMSASDQDIEVATGKILKNMQAMAAKGKAAADELPEAQWNRFVNDLEQAGLRIFTVVKGPLNVLLGALRILAPILEGLGNEVMDFARQIGEAVGYVWGKLKELWAWFSATGFGKALISWMKPFTDQVKGQFADAFKDVTDAMATAKKGFEEPPKLAPGKGGPVLVNNELLQKQIKEAEQLLNEAKARLSKVSDSTIGAVAFSYASKAAEFLKEKNKTALKILNEAYITSIQAAIQVLDKHADEQVKKLQERDAAIRRDIAIGAFEGAMDETVAREMQQAEQRRAARVVDLRTKAAIEIRAFADQYAKELSALDASDLAKKSPEEYLKQRKILVDSMTAYGKAQGKGLIDEEEKERIDSLNKIHELQIKQAKELRDTRLQYLEGGINAEIAQRRAEIELNRPQTLEARTSQIQQLEGLEIESIKRVSDARLAAFDENMRVRQEEASKVQDSALREARQMELLGEQFVLQRKEIEMQAQTDIQMARFQAWKATDDAILEEQKAMYESMKSAVDKVWDALMDRSKSVWASIGNAIKTAVMGAMKDIVTSRIAASLTETIGGGKVSFGGGRRGLLGEQVIFQGNTAARPDVLRWDMNNARMLNAAGQGLLAAAGGLNDAAASLAAVASGIGGGGIGGGAGGVVDIARSNIASAGASIAGAQAAAQSGGGAGLPAGVPYIATPPFVPAQLPAIFGTSAPAAPAGGTRSGTAQAFEQLKTKFGIGQPVTYQTATGGWTTVPWAQAPAMAKLTSVLSSPGAAALALGVGSTMALGGLQSHNIASTIVGSTLTGAGALMSLFPAAGIGAGITGAGLGLGVGIAAAGLMRGGKVGLGMSVGGGALTGAILGSFFPGIGTAIGAGIGAAIGGIAGLIRMGMSTLEQDMQQAIFFAYGITIKDKSVLTQLADIARTNFGGNARMAAYSPQVQELVRLYALSKGLPTGGLPRPMYPATFAQSQAGGLQLQPVYSGGQLVPSPYVGTTTTQFTNAGIAGSPLFMQLNPQQATALFSGQVIQVLGNNPGAVASANTTAAQQGTSRTAQSSALLEPLTITR